MADASNPVALKVIYLTSKRAEERSVLSAMSWVEHREVNFHLRSNSLITILKNMKDFLVLLLKFKPDLLLLEQPGGLTSVVIIAKFIFGVPYAVRLKGDFWRAYAEIKLNIPYKEKLVLLLNYVSGAMVIRHASILLPVAEHLAAVFRRNLAYDKEIHTVHLPLGNHGTEDSSSSDIDGINDKKFVLTVTNFNFWAKVSPLLDAMEITAPILNDAGFVWVILGDGHFYDEFMLLARERVKSENLVFMGRREPWAYYRGASALFYISGADGLPNVVLESFASKLPVIMDAGCPAVGFVRDNMTGYIIDFSNRDMVRAFVDKYAATGFGAAETVDNAYQYATEEFSVQRIASQLGAAFDKLVAGQGKRREP